MAVGRHFDALSICPDDEIEATSSTFVTMWTMAPMGRSTGESQDRSPQSGAQTVTRAIRLLKLIASQPPEGARLTDVARLLELERPTAHRLLQALTGEGMLVQHKASRRYSLGAVVFELGLLAAHQFNLNSLCMPVLTSLSRWVGDTSFLFVRSGDDAVCIARAPGSYAIQTPVVPAGSRQPLGVNAGGLALLTALPDAEVDKILHSVDLRLQAYAGLDIDLVRQHLGKARKAGYALIANHAVPGISAVGIPIRDAGGQPIAAITVATVVSRMKEERVVNEVVPRLEIAAAEIRHLLKQ